MKAIENILATNKAFLIDEMACMQHAKVIKNYLPTFLSTAWEAYPKDVQLGFKVAFISVCHQFNWDFLQKCLSENLLGSSYPLVYVLQNIRSIDLEDWLQDYPKKERIQAKMRAKILRDIGNTFARKFDSNLTIFHDTCSKAKLGDKTFEKLMDNFPAYKSDSLRKKTNVLSHDLIKEKIVIFEDPKEAEPAVDYHIMRLYLRTGRVVPTDKALFRFIEGSPNPRGSLVRQLRESTSKAVKLTAFYSDLNVADVNYIEWQIGRSICLNINPACKNHNFSTAELASDIIPLCRNQCPYINDCLSANTDPRFINFEEPRILTKEY